MTTKRRTDQLDRWRPAVEILTLSGSVKLDLKPGESPAARWIAVPPELVTLDPAEDGRSCTAWPKGTGRCTVKAIDASRNAVAYFSLAIEADPKPAEARAVAAELEAPPSAIEAHASAPE